MSPINLAKPRGEQTEEQRERYVEKIKRDYVGDDALRDRVRIQAAQSEVIEEERNREVDGG